MLIRLVNLYKLNIGIYNVVSTRFKSSLSATEIRQAFFDYFIRQRQHTYWKSSSVLPGEDAHLSFVNAGMYQVCFIRNFNFF